MTRHHIISYRGMVCQACGAPIRGDTCEWCAARRELRHRGQTNSRENGKDAPIGKPLYEQCPRCQQRTLQRENGCVQCVNPDCLYSVCSA